HSLRKRVRVDYSLDPFGDEPAAGPEGRGKAVVPQSARGRKRRVDAAQDDEESDEFRAASAKAPRPERDLAADPTGSPRRKNPPRRASTYQENSAVKDTIEVVGDATDSESEDHSSFHQNSSGPSSSAGSPAAASRGDAVAAGGAGDPR